MRTFSFLLGVPLLMAVAGCSAQGAVSLTGSLGNASLTVEDGMLVTTLSGAFDVHLELGERASGGTDVSFSAFSLIRADTGAAVLAKEHLSVVTTATLPVRIEPGGKASIPFQVGEGEAGGEVTPMELAKGDFTLLCDAGAVQIRGTMMDSANGQRPSALYSMPFTPEGCP